MLIYISDLIKKHNVILVQIFPFIDFDDYNLINY